MPGIRELPEPVSLLSLRPRARTARPTRRKIHLEEAGVLLIPEERDFQALRSRWVIRPIIS